MDGKPNPSSSLEWPGDNAGEWHTEYIATAMKTSLTKLKPNRRWLQTSLRAVLLFVTLLCVALSLWVVPAERRRRAVNAIEALGGTVILNSETRKKSSAEAVLRRWLPEGYVDEIEYVLLDGPEITDAGLANLQGLTGLLGLTLENTWVTDAGLLRLQGLTNLQAIILRNTQITDAGLVHLKGLTGLRWLWVDKTQVTHTGLAQLRKALPKCQIDEP